VSQFHGTFLRLRNSTIKKVPPSQKHTFRLPDNRITNVSQQTKYCLLVIADCVAEHVDSQPENPYAGLVDGQSIAIIPEFELESGVLLRDAPVAYKTWGKLNAQRSNVLIICHALSGSADVEDWFVALRLLEICH